MRSTKVNYIYLEEEEAPPLDLYLQIRPYYYCYKQYQLCRKGKLFFALERLKKGRDLYIKTRWEERKKIRRENELKTILNFKNDIERKKKKI